MTETADTQFLKVQVLGSSAPPSGGNTPSPGHIRALFNRQEVGTGAGGAASRTLGRVASAATSMPKSTTPPERNLTVRLPRF